MAPDVKHTYDEKADVLYVTFGTGEPSFTESVDDVVLVEIGFFSRQITGFRVVGVTQHLAGLDRRIASAVRRIAQREARTWRTQGTRSQRATAQALRRVPELVS